jgi:hypothetical protein
MRLVQDCINVMGSTCRKLGFALYDILVNYWHFASRTLPQFEKLDSILNIPESSRTDVRELIRLQRDVAELSDLKHIHKLKKEVFRAAQVDNCEEELKAIVTRGSKTVTSALIFLRKQILLNKQFTIEYDYTPESHEALYRKAIAGERNCQKIRFRVTIIISVLRV